MKELHTEGPATHGDPESCGDGREAAIEALTGARAGWVLSRETNLFPGADAVLWAAGNTDMAVMAWPCPIRYADDFIVGFQHESTARGFQRELEARLRRFQLELHPDKTRLIRFGAFAAAQRAERGEGKPETFSFLGFRHICSKTKSGKYLIARHTDAQRMHRKLREIKTELWQRWHLPVSKQGVWLRSVVRGSITPSQPTPAAWMLSAITSCAFGAARCAGAAKGIARLGSA